jgi:hypothetical protein
VGGGLRNTTTIWLDLCLRGNLDIDELLGGSCRWLRDLVVARGGRPFFVERSCALVDAGKLEKDDVGWHVRAL